MLNPAPFGADRHELILKAACGNESAAAFLETIMEILHFWDDLVDRDKSLPDVEINERMWQALVVLPRNVFYQANFSALNPILAAAIHSWMAATAMERDGTAPDLAIAFIIRSNYIDLVTAVAQITGGFGWAHQATMAARRLVHREGFEQYQANLKRERGAANGIPQGE
jgi:hypothetical protein